MPILVNGQKVKVTKFPGGEVNVCVREYYLSEGVEIKAFLHNSDDIMSLVMTVDAVRRTDPHLQIDLIIPYFPYARQDRVCNNGEALSAKVMANIINSLGADSVRVWDPHSNVTKALLDNYIDDEIEQTDGYELVADCLREIKCLDSFNIIAPDHGAVSRALRLTDLLEDRGVLAAVDYCTKHRHPMTGEISGISVPDHLPGRRFIMADDICDGGATFIGIAKQLRQQGAKEVLLYVTHGIFSKGLHVLKEHINHVYCMHTFLKPEDRDNEFLTVLGADDAY